MIKTILEWFKPRPRLDDMMFREIRRAKRPVPPKPIPSQDERRGDDIMRNGCYCRPVCNGDGTMGHNCTCNSTLNGVRTCEVDA